MCRNGSHCGGHDRHQVKSKHKTAIITVPSRETVEDRARSASNGIPGKTRRQAAHGGDQKAQSKCRNRDNSPRNWFWSIVRIAIHCPTHNRGWICVHRVQSKENWTKAKRSHKPTAASSTNRTSTSVVCQLLLRGRRAGTSSTVCHVTNKELNRSNNGKDNTNRVPATGFSVHDRPDRVLCPPSHLDDVVHQKTNAPDQDRPLQTTDTRLRLKPRCHPCRHANTQADCSHCKTRHWVLYQVWSQSNKRQEEKHAAVIGHDSAKRSDTKNHGWYRNQKECLIARYPHVPQWEVPRRFPCLLIKREYHRLLY